MLKIASVRSTQQSAIGWGKKLFAPADTRGKSKNFKASLLTVVKNNLSYNTVKYLTHRNTFEIE